MTAGYQELKVKRSAAKRNFTTVYNQLLPLLKIVGGNVNANDLINKFEKCWEALETSHENYAATFDDADSDTFEAANESEENIAKYFSDNHEKMLEVQSLIQVYRSRSKFHAAYVDYSYQTN